MMATEQHSWQRHEFSITQEPSVMQSAIKTAVNYRAEAEEVQES